MMRPLKQWSYAWTPTSLGLTRTHWPAWLMALLSIFISSCYRLTKTLNFHLKCSQTTRIITSSVLYKGDTILLSGYFTPVWSRVWSSSHQSCDKRYVTILLWLDIRSWAQTWCNRFWHGKQSLFKLFTSVTFLHVYLYYLFMFNFTLQVNHIIHVYCLLNNYF